MEKDKSKKFVCKYCNKRYPCGKSLGGHLRSHRIVNNSVDEDEKVKLSQVFGRNINNMEMKSLSEFGEQSQTQTASALKEKPKGTWRLSNSGTSSLQQQQLLKICKECGKGFQSVKALCGHMACHSEKDKQKLVMDDDDGEESGSELSGLRQPRRSKRMRNRALDVYTLINGGCSSVSESEQEQEEVALCLMMLSKDTRKWIGVSSVESFGNNSTKSYSSEMEIVRKGRLTRNSSFVEYKGNKNLEDGESGNGEFEFSDDSDADYFEGEMNNVESDNSGELFLRDIGLKKPKIRHGSGFQGSVSQSRYNPNGFGHSKCKSRKNFMEEDEYTEENRASKKYKTRETRDDSLSPEVLKSFHKFESGSSSYDVKVYSESMNCSNENGQDTDPCYAQTSVSKPLESSRLVEKKKPASNSGKKPGSRKSKGHKCPFCPKTFRSGQALGGHKRIHFVGRTEGRTIVIKQDMSNLLDLNLPAPIEEEVDEHPGLMPW